MHDGDAEAPNLVIVLLHIRFEEYEVATERLAVHIARALLLAKRYLGLWARLDFVIGALSVGLAEHADFDEAKELILVDLDRRNGIVVLVDFVKLGGVRHVSLTGSGDSRRCLVVLVDSLPGILHFGWRTGHGLWARFSLAVGLRRLHRLRDLAHFQLYLGVLLVLLHGPRAVPI